MTPQAVVITDVVGSSKLTDHDRRELDGSLRQLFKQFNQTYEQDLSAWFDFTVGDEFQAVFHHADRAIRPVFLLHAWLASQAGTTPFRVRSVVGIGRVSVQSSHHAREQDGPAFHTARDLIRAIHKRKQSLGVAYHGSATSILAQNQGLDTICRLTSALMAHWTRAQWEAAYWRWAGKPSHEVADLLKITPQNISKRLKGADFPAADQALSYLELLINDRTPSRA